MTQWCAAAFGVDYTINTKIRFKIFVDNDV